MSSFPQQRAAQAMEEVLCGGRLDASLQLQFTRNRKASGGQGEQGERRGSPPFGPLLYRNMCPPHVPPWIILPLSQTHSASCIVLSNGWLCFYIMKLKRETHQKKGNTSKATENETNLTHGYYCLLRYWDGSMLKCFLNDLQKESASEYPTICAILSIVSWLFTRRRTALSMRV